MVVRECWIIGLSLKRGHHVIGYLQGLEPTEDIGELFMGQGDILEFCLGFHGCCESLLRAGE